MSHDIPQDIIRYRNEFAAKFCADMGLPPPEPWTEEDEARYQAEKVDINRKVSELRAARLKGEAA
ncbi:hypothetical protein [Actinoplanes sp. HUAS TT8]|uniref:hypothetical protein n=1 Tax=Actinoplanes sp. HUAS TT8 TaxID=3447453 RepID=UPI003F527918